MKIQHDAPIRFSVKISKVDEETREVEGIATQEVLDAHNQVVDYESMKALATSWPGNIREMHQPKAVGKAVSLETRDADRSINIRVRVSKGAPDTWEKVKEGVLSAFSIGGVGRVVTEKDATGHDVGRVFMQKWTETSLVDNPACPTAQFEICKSVNGELVGVQPAEPEAAAAPEVAMLGSPLIVKLGLLATSKLVERPIHKIQVDGKVIEKRAEPYDVQQALQCIAYLESLVANEMFEAEYADVFGEGDNAATQKTEIGYLRGAAGLLLQFLVSEFEGQFAGMDAAGAAIAGDVAMAKRREQFAAALEVFEKSLPASWAKADGSGSLWFAKAGARHSKKDLEMIQNMHDTSVGLGAVCEDADDDDVENVQRTAAEAAATAAAEKIKNTTDDVRAAATALAATQVLTPVPAVAAPAAAEPAATTTVVVDKKTDPAPAAKVDEPAPAPAAVDSQAQTVTKLLASIEALTKATEAQQATHLSEVAELRAAIKKLEDQPMPGGPKTRATDEPKGSPAHKTLGNAPGAGAADGVDADVIDQVLTGLIKEATDDGQRMLLVEKQLAHRRQFGIGMMRVERETVHPKPV